MSGGDDNFLARWSRRKREVGEGAERNVDGPSPPCGERMGEGFSGVERGADDPCPDPFPPEGGEQPQPTEPSEPLPRLEDLTAESDLTAFLRKGVPEALKQAALRRMWSLDPAIRDHVGLAEYAYDFNNPASIPGFGSVAAGSPMAQLAAGAMSGAKKAADAGFAGSHISPKAPAVPAPRADIPAALPEGEAEKPAPDPVRPAASAPSGPGPAETIKLTAASEARSGERDAPESAGEAENKPAPRHGGAMPR